MIAIDTLTSIAAPLHQGTVNENDVSTPVVAGLITNR